MQRHLKNLKNEKFNAQKVQKYYTTTLTTTYTYVVVVYNIYTM